MKNKKVKKLVGQMGNVANYLISFAQTYLGIYDENGNQVEKGDRDYLFEALEKIEKKLETLEREIEGIKKKL